MKKFLTASALALSLFLVTLLPAGAQTLFQPEELHKQPPKVPAFAVFAGDTIRFDRQDFYESMDRELISFTYMHSTTLLMLKRAPRFFAQVEPVLKANGVPDDLKYLMVIESNLDPTALSTAKAAGLWQFTKATAQKYGLEVSDEVDERYHIEKETEAACRYLLEARAKYDDWFTVAASYNAGQAGISRRLESQHQSSALELWLPAETARYMFRIIAAKMLFEHPESFGFHIIPSECYPYIPPRTSATISEPVPDLADFAEEHGTNYNKLKKANLWLRDSKLTNKNHKSYTVLIP